MPPSNPRSFTQLLARKDPDSAPGRKAGRGGKPGRDTAKSGTHVHFEPFAKRAYDMSYACLLIPRNPEHLLTGKVAEFISGAMRDTCATFGWELGILQVRPQYMQWVLSATVGTPPSKCIHTIREQTSKGILEKFKQFRDKDPYKDFWAPGYLVLVSAEPHPQNIIDEFIHLTRQQQGLSRQGG